MVLMLRNFILKNGSEINYLLPKKKSKKEQYKLNSNYMSYFSKFWGNDKFNSNASDVNINLAWVIYIMFKFVNYIDKNSEFYKEVVMVYQKYNIILNPKVETMIDKNVSLELLQQLEKLCEQNKEKDLEAINNLINGADEYKVILKQSVNNRDENKYTHFLFDREYTKYTGIDKRFFSKIK